MHEQTDATPTTKRGDVVFTPDWCAADMVRHFRPTGIVLEPCRGDGVFLRYLPASARWCEIGEGVDFFKWTGRVDWIVTNPPYSQTRPFMRHAFKVADNVVFLVPARNIFSGYGTVRESRDFGGMAAIRWYGTGGKLGFPMGNAVAAIYWQRGYAGPTAQTFHEDEARPGLEGGAHSKQRLDVEPYCRECDGPCLRRPRHTDGCW